MKNVFILFAACGLTLSAQADCYSVYSRTGNLVHQSIEAPVDTRLQYQDTVPQRFGPGATLVYVRDNQPCTELTVRTGLSGTDTMRSAGRPGRADRG